MTLHKSWKISVCLLVSTKVEPFPVLLTFIFHIGPVDTYTFLYGSFDTFMFHLYIYCAWDTFAFHNGPVDTFKFHWYISFAADTFAFPCCRCASSFPLSDRLVVACAAYSANCPHIIINIIVTPIIIIMSVANHHHPVRSSHLCICLRSNTSLWIAL